MSRTRVVVGVGDLKVTASQTDMLVTYALGSCIGVTAWDPVVRVGGMLHAMLPTASINETRESWPRYVDTGMTELVERCRRSGAAPERLILKAAGGSSVAAADTDVFRIGARNFDALERFLAERGMGLCSSDIGGSCSRTMSLDVATGRVALKIDGIEVLL